MKLVYEKFGTHNIKVIRFLAKYNIYHDYMHKCEDFYRKLNPGAQYTEEIQEALREYYFYFKTIL